MHSLVPLVKSLSGVELSFFTFACPRTAAERATVHLWGPLQPYFNLLIPAPRIGSEDSPRGDGTDHTESQAVVAELFIAAAEVWRMTLAKIEIERMLKEELAEEARAAAEFEALCSRVSSRAATPLLPMHDADDELQTEGGPSGGAARRASLTMSRRHQRRRSSIQANVNTSLLAMDDATKGLLSENNSRAGSARSSRRNSASVSPAPFLSAADMEGHPSRPTSAAPPPQQLVAGPVDNLGTLLPCGALTLTAAPPSSPPSRPPDILTSFTIRGAAAAPADVSNHYLPPLHPLPPSHVTRGEASDLPHSPVSTGSPKPRPPAKAKKVFATVASKVANALRLKGAGTSLRMAEDPKPKPTQSVRDSNSDTHDDLEESKSPLTRAQTKSLRSAAQHQAFRKKESQRRPSRWDAAGADEEDEEKIREQYRRPDEITPTEEALASYAVQQRLQGSLAMSAQAYAKITGALVRQGYGVSNQGNTVLKDVDGRLLSMSHKRKSSAVGGLASAPPASNDAEEQDPWKSEGRAAAHAKALEVAKRYVTHGTRTNLQKHVEFLKGTWAPRAPPPPQSPKHPHAQSRRASQTMFQSGFIAFAGDESQGTVASHSPPHAASPTSKVSSNATPTSPARHVACPTTTTAHSHENTAEHPQRGQHPGSFSFGTFGNVPPSLSEPVTTAMKLPPLALHTVGSLPKWAPAWTGLDSTIIEPLPTPKGPLPTTTAGAPSAHDESGSQSTTSSKPTSQPFRDIAGTTPSSDKPTDHQSSSGGGGSRPPLLSAPLEFSPRDVGDVSHIVFLKSASNHLIDLKEKVYVRLWTSRREAKKFVRGMAAVTQALHTLHLPTCVACPYTVLVHVERAVVTVTWLPPIRSEEAIRIRDRGNRVNLIRYMMRAVDCALVIGGDGASPAVDDVLESLRRPDERKALVSLTSTFEGVDGRYYMFFTGLHNNSAASDTASSSTASPSHARGSYGSSFHASTRRTPKSRDTSPRAFQSNASSPVERRRPFEGPIWTAVDQRTVPQRSMLDANCRVLLDSSRVVAALAEDPPAASAVVDLESTAVLGATAVLDGSRVASPRGGASRRDSDFSPRSASSPRNPTLPVMPPFALEYAITKQLFQEVAEELKWLQSLHKRPIGVPAANVPASVTAYHGLLMFLSSTLFVRGSLIAPVTTPMQTPMKVLRDAVKNTLRYAETLTKEDTPSAVLLYCFLGEILPLSTISHTKRIAKKVSNVSRMQENLLEWEADEHAMEHVAMTLVLHMVEGRGKLMVDVAEMWSWNDESKTSGKQPLTPAPPRGEGGSAEESAKLQFMRSARNAIKKTSKDVRQYKPSVPNPAETLVELKVAMSDVTAVWGTCVAGALYRLAFARSVALFHKVSIQMVLPDHQHTAIDSEGGTPHSTSASNSAIWSPLGDATSSTSPRPGPPRRPITDPDGDSDPARRTEREMHKGLPVARGVLAPLMLGIDLRHSACLQIPSEIHGLLYHDRASSKTPSTKATGGVRDQLVMEYHSTKLSEAAAQALLAREQQPIVDVVTLAGWLLAYAPLLLPERLVSVTKVCRLLRGEDDDTLRLLGKALAISVASAFSVVDLRSSKLMRCITMAQKTMLIVGSVDMSLIQFTLKPIDGDDVHMMLNVLCEDMKRIAGGVFSASKWSDAQINAFRTLRHIMRSNSQGVRGNSVFNLNEQLETLADFRLTVHDTEDQMVLDHNASVVLVAAPPKAVGGVTPPSLPPIRQIHANSKSTTATTNGGDPRDLRDGFSFTSPRPTSTSPAASAISGGSFVFNPGFTFGDDDGTTLTREGGDSRATPREGELTYPVDSGGLHSNASASTQPQLQQQEADVPHAREASTFSWSGFGRFASSGSVVSQSMLSPTATATTAVSLATTASLRRVTAATSFEGVAGGDGFVGFPSAPSLPKLGSASHSGRSIPKKRSVMLLNVDHLPPPSPANTAVSPHDGRLDTDGSIHRMSSPLPFEGRSHSGSRAEPKSATNAGGVRSKWSISRRSSLPRAPSPVIVVPPAPSESLFGILPVDGVGDSPTLLSPAIPGWNEDTDPNAIVDFSASTTRHYMNASTRADQGRVRSLSILGANLSPRSAEGGNGATLHLSLSDRSDTSHISPMSAMGRGLRDALEELERQCRFELDEEECTALTVLTIQSSMSLQYLHDVYGSPLPGSTPSTEPSSMPPLLDDVVVDNTLESAEHLNDQPDVEAMLAELVSVDEVVGRTEVEVFERIEFAPLLSEYTKSLMAAALRGAGGYAAGGRDSADGTPPKKPTRRAIGFRRAANGRTHE